MKKIVLKNEKNRVKNEKNRVKNEKNRVKNAEKSVLKLSQTSAVRCRIKNNRQLDKFCKLFFQIFCLNKK